MEDFLNIFWYFKFFLQIDDTYTACFRL